MAIKSNQSRHDNGTKCTSYALSGSIFIAIGLGVLFYIYAFESMISPDIKGLDRWIEILRNTFSSASVVVVFIGMFVIGVGITFIAASVRMALGKGSFISKKTGKFMALIVLAVILMFIILGSSLSVLS